MTVAERPERSGRSVEGQALGKLAFEEHVATPPARCAVELPGITAPLRTPHG